MSENIKIPGVAWALLIVVAIGLIHEYEAQLPFNAVVWDGIVVMLVAILKSIKLGTEELNQALDIIDLYRKQLNSKRVRGAESIEEVGSVEFVHVNDALIPERPNRGLRWLFG